MMTDFVVTSVFVALVASFCITVAKKWGIIETLQAYAPTETVYKLLSCDFCLSFWVSCVLAVCVAVSQGEWVMLLCPVCSAKISQYLLQI